MNCVKMKTTRTSLTAQVFNQLAMALNIIRKSFKFRIYPTKQQKASLDNTLTLCRELYNAALQERRDAYKFQRISISYKHQANQLNEIKTIRKDLKDVHSQVLQDVLRRVDKAFQNFFRRVKTKQGKAGFPRFQGANRYDSFTYPQSGFSLTSNKLTLSKIGKVKIKLSQKITGKVKTCTIKREIDKWFLIFSVETATKPLPKTNKQIGIDVGIESFATLSDGTQIDNFKYFESTQKKLRVAQRLVSRRKKGSGNRRKAVLKLRKIHQKIKNQRADFQHKVSTYLVKEYDLIAIEKLNISGMSKGILSKQVHDVAWSNFFKMLRYKAANADKQLIEVNPRGTSQTCVCGKLNKKDLSVRWHLCSSCGLSIHRDHCSALVILNRAVGQTVLDLTYATRQSVSKESAY